MQLMIRNNTAAPIYQQIYQQIKEQIINGTLEEDTMLPSIRSLAKELRISIITTKRAYEELEREGYIVSVVGKGSFVAPKNTELVREEKQRQVEEYLSKAVETARTYGISLKELTEVLVMLYGED